MVPDAQDGTPPRAAALPGDRPDGAIGDGRSQASAPLRPGAACSSRHAFTGWLVDVLARSRTIMTARGPITAVAVAMLSASLTACGAPTTTVTQPAGDAPLGRSIGADPPTSDPGDQDARAAARAFLSSYLAISYGQAQPSQLRAASRALRDRLRAQNARVPPGVRKRRARVVALRLKRTADGRVRAIATVDDGDLAPYPLFATLQRAGAGRWVAVSVGG
jgi:hypothetical protein